MLLMMMDDDDDDDDFDDEQFTKFTKCLGQQIELMSTFRRLRHAALVTADSSTCAQAHGNSCLRLYQSLRACMMHACLHFGIVLLSIAHRLCVC